MPPKLKIYDDEGKREVDLVYDKVSFGRDEKCTVQIRDTMSSREHCVIEKSGGAEWRLVDLDSRNGTRVNGQGVKEHLLSHGDEVAIGDVVIRFENPGGARTSGRSKQRPSSTSNKRPSKITSGTRRPRAMGSRGGDNTTAIVGAIVAGVMLLAVIAIASSGGGGPSDDALLNQAQQAIRMSEFDKAEKLLARAGGSKRKTSLKEDLETARNAARMQETARVADREWSRIEIAMAKGELKGPKALSEVKRFIRDFPDMSATRQAEAVAEKLAGELGTGSGGDMGGEDMGGDFGGSGEAGGASGGSSGSAGGSSGGGGTLTQQVDRLVQRQEYDEAIRKLTQHFQRTGDTKVNDRIDEISTQADAAWERAKQQARIAIEAKNAARARELLTFVKERYGGRWSQEADAELAKIPAD